MSRSLAAVSLLVADYDEALGFYVGRLGFELVEDTPQGPDRRWVVVAAPGGGARLVLARAKNAAERAAVGHQAGGRVFLFLETRDFAADFAALGARGVRFLEEPRNEPYGTVAVFADLYGNKWDLIGPSRNIRPG